MIQDQMTDELMHDIADQVARYWRKKGILSYHYEEMFQDACEVIVYASKRFRPEKGDLRGYCFWAARNAVWHRATKGMAPVSSRGNDHSTTRAAGSTRVNRWNYSYESPAIRRAIERPSSLPTEGSADYLDYCAWRGRVRIRIMQIVADVEDADIGVEALMTHDGLGVLVAKGYARERVRRAVERVRRRVKNDRKMYQLARDMPR